jgi:hypothetical protein
LIRIMVGNNLGNMEDEPLVLESALRHGVSELECRFAYLNAMYVAATTGQAGEMVILIGPRATGGGLLELGVVEWFGEFAIVHAMTARRKYLIGGVSG